MSPSESGFRQEDRFRALSVGRIGLWHWFIPTDELTIEQYGQSDQRVSVQIRPLKELIHPADVPDFVAQVYNQSDGASPFTVVIRARIVDGADAEAGKWTWVTVHGQVIERDAANMPIRVIAQHSEVDLTSQSSAGWLPEEMYQTILSNISDTVIITDRAGRFRFICPNVHVIFGYSEDEIKDLHDVSSILGSGLLASLPASLGEETTNIERKIIDKFGDLHTLLVNIKVVPIWGESILFTCRDISERQRVSQALQDSEERYRLIVNTAHEGIWQIDNDLRINYANPHLVEMLGYQPEDLFGKPYYEFVDPEFQEQAILFSDQRRVQGTLQTETKFRRKDGTVLWGLVASSNIYDDMGHQIGGIAFITDITERITAEELLRQQTRNIEEINRVLYQQLSDNIAAKKALAENEAALAALINNVDDSIFSIDANRCLISFNLGFSSRAKQRLGFDVFKGMVLADHFPKPYLDAYFPLFDRVLKGESFTVPLALYMPSINVDLHNEVTCNPLYSEVGTVTGAAIFVRDVTESWLAQAALKESEQRFREVVENVPLAFHIYDAERDKITYINDIAESTMQAVTGKPLAGRSDWIARIHPEDMVSMGDRLTDPVALTNPNLEYRVVYPSGDTRYVRHLSFPIGERGGQVQQVASFIEDITERKQTERALAWNAGLLSNLVANLPIGVVVYSLEGQILIANGLSVNYFDNSLQAMMGANVKDVLSETQLQQWTRLNEQTLQAGQLVEFQSKGVSSGGAKPPTLIMGSFPLRDADGDIFALGRTMVDISAQVETQEQLRELSQQIIEIQEKERRHIARELHDEVGQSLTGVLLMLNKLQRISGDIGSPVIEQIQGVIRQLMTQIRELSHNLHPPILDNHGLMSALQWYCNHYATQTQIQVAFKYTGSQQRLLSDIELTCYRVVQEALTNIARYAQTNAAKVNLSVSPKRVKLTIEDHGIGFNVQRVVEGNATFGLSGMRERIKLLRGELNIVSAPGQGTLITVEIPLVGRN